MNAVDNTAITCPTQSASVACFVAFSVHVNGNLYLPPVFSVTLSHANLHSLRSQRSTQMERAENESHFSLFCLLVAINGIVETNLGRRDSRRKWPSYPIQLGPDYEYENDLVQKYIDF